MQLTFVNSEPETFSNTLHAATCATSALFTDDWAARDILVSSRLLFINCDAYNFPSRAAGVGNPISATWGSHCNCMFAKHITALTSTCSSEFCLLLVCHQSNDHIFSSRPLPTDQALRRTVGRNLTNIANPPGKQAHTPPRPSVMKPSATSLMFTSSTTRPGRCPG